MRRQQSEGWAELLEVIQLVTALSMESLAHVLEKTLLEKVATQVKESLEESSELSSLVVVVPLSEMSDEDS